MSYKFTTRKSMIAKMSDAKASREVLRRLRAFLDEKEPQLIYLLVNTWHAQGRAITYKELREAILDGEISPDVIEDWQQDYAAFIARHLTPAYIEAMEAATEEMERRYPDWYFDPDGAGVREWVDTRCAAFVTEVSGTQIEGLRAVVQQAAVLESIGVDQLARAIRPMVGLTAPQARANLKYFENLIANGTSEKRATDLSIRYAARQHRYRAQNIARTEMAFAFNQGAYEGTKQAQEKGYMGDVVKVWCTADDERVCKICGGLEGTQVGMDEPFNFRTRLATSENPTIRMMPPAHPSCRCAAMFKEISPPIGGTEL